MRDILNAVEEWIEAGESIALATVVQTWGSSPRKAGSHMAFTTSGKIVGSVSGGCVENAVIEAGILVLKTNHPQLLQFGVADEAAWEVGLACGGSISVFVQPLNLNILRELKNIVNNGFHAIHVTVINGTDELIGKELLIQENQIIFGSFGNQLNTHVLMMTRQISNSQRLLISNEVEVFVKVIQPEPTLVIVGGVHIAVALVALAQVLGYKTIVIDPRKAWGNAERFPTANQLIQRWVDKAFDSIKLNVSTAVAVLTHDPKIDDPAIKIALNSSAFYVGALGSKNTNAKRRERLLSDGVGEEQISRLHAPIGLDIGAQSPEEIALAVMSEVVKSYREQNQIEVENEAKQVQSLITEVS